MAAACYKRKKWPIITHYSALIHNTLHYDTALEREKQAKIISTCNFAFRNGRLTWNFVFFDQN